MPKPSRPSGAGLAVVSLIWVVDSVMDGFWLLVVAGSGAMITFSKRAGQARQTSIFSLLRKFFDIRTETLKPGAIRIFRGQRKAFAPNDIPQFLDCIFSLHLVEFNI